MTHRQSEGPFDSYCCRRRALPDPEGLPGFQLGVSMEIMGGIPGIYAPDCAGEALFEAMLRAMKEHAGKEGV